MPVSKFTTPIQAVPLTPKPRLPVKEIMATLDRLTQSQEQGMIAKSKFDLLRSQLNEQVLDVERDAANKVFSRYDDAIATMTRDGDYINAAPRIAMMAAKFQGDLGRFTGNYERYQQSIENYAKLVGTNKANAADFEYFIGRQLEGLEREPGGRFNFAPIPERVDEQELIEKFASGFKNEKGDTVRWVEDPQGIGSWVNITTQEGVSYDEVLRATSKFLSSNSAVLAQSERDARYRLKQEFRSGLANLDPDVAESMTSEDVEAFKEEFYEEKAKTEIIELQERRDKINANTELTEEEKEANLRIVDRSIEQHRTDSENALIGDYIEDKFERLITPYATREGRLSVTQRYQRGFRPLTGGLGAGFAQGIVMAADVGGRDNKFLSGADLERGIEEIDELIKLNQETIADPNTTTLHRETLENQTELLKDQREFAATVKQRALDESGLDPDLIEELSKSLGEKLRESNTETPEPDRKKWIEFLVGLHNANFTTASEEAAQDFRELSAKEQGYFLEYQDWFLELNQAKRDHTRKFDEALMKVQIESTLINGVLFPKQTDQTTLINIVQGRQTNVGVTVHKDGKIVPTKDLQNFDKMGRIISIGAIVPNPANDTADIVVHRESGEYIHKMRMDELGDYFSGAIRRLVFSAGNAGARIAAVNTGFEQRVASSKISKLQPGDSTIFRVNGEEVFQVHKDEDSGNYLLLNMNGTLLEAADGSVLEYTSSSQAANLAGEHRRALSLIE